MNTLQSQQIWDLMRAHHTDLLKEAERQHLANLATQSNVNWWQKLSRRPAQNPRLALNASAAPELG